MVAARTVPITVILPTLPERAWLLAAALRSFDAQIVPPADVLIATDHDREGPIVLCNRLAEQVTTEWLFPFADDDLLDPHHFQVLGHACAAAAENVAVVYTWCRLEHPTSPPDLFQVRPADVGGFGELRRRNFIPACAAIRTAVWRELGGYQDPGLLDHEDWHLWLRILNAGYSFRCVLAVTWTYRAGGDWQHYSDVRRRARL